MAVQPPKLEVKEPVTLPHAGFDPLTATPAELDYYWLPAKPDPVTQPELYEHWSEMMSPAPAFVAAQSQPPPFPFATSVPEPLHHNRLRSRLQNSRNWSGAYLSSNHANRFTRVVGRWTVPQIRPGVRAKQEPAGLAFKCSIWIGLDGKKRWTESMPQVGSGHKVQDGGVGESHELWWQWWHRDSPAVSDYLPWTIKGVPISAGDLILCSLNVSSTDPKTVRLHVVNRTSGIFATVQLKREPVLGSTAEWVVERPGDWATPIGINKDGPLFPLPNYGEVIIDRCATEHAFPPAQPAFLPRLIRMKQKFQQFNRVAVISNPSVRREPPARIRVNYHEP
ncbi:G1 family glutamic endopeptidase [Bradyrhizobium manausense]|uniref:Peptidase A4 n=1 Tax=Bradyrhizobium manausense TaxID=989370 RepID=A0A0R3CTT5_9BRAD|nr:G1 family glutamic endopeptidase [Bradyrhizobium manausense]KRQ01032.1 hypothetical protein AOQ71_39315 [Bradyrhizobium manausense]